MASNNPEHTYWRLQVSTGIRDECKTHTPYTRADLYKLLNQWNSQAPGVYVYWQDYIQKNADGLRGIY